MHMTDISIHTPTKGVTDFQKKQYDTNKYFNPHSHEGSDAIKSTYDPMFTKISIHTPTKGVTIDGKMQLHVKIKFQSTLPRRE